MLFHYHNSKPFRVNPCRLYTTREPGTTQSPSTSGTFPAIRIPRIRFPNTIPPLP
jgi:hypothetical protein